MRGTGPHRSPRWAPVLMVLAVCVAASAGALVGIADQPHVGALNWKWTLLHSFGASPMFDVASCPTATACWIGGEASPLSPSLFETVDGGTTWQGHRLPSGDLASSGYSGIACSSPAHCVAATGHGGPLALLATVNSGATWHVSRFSFQADGGSTSVACPSARVCYALAGNDPSGLVLGTTDGGLRWRRLSHLTQWPWITTSISCSSVLSCIAVGQTGKGHGYAALTRNGGASWTVGAVPQRTSQLTSLTCLTARRCVALSTTGQLSVTTDGGSTWATSPSPKNREVFANGLWCRTVRTCLAGGVPAGTSERQLIGVRTENGGVTWEPLVARSSGYSRINNIVCAKGGTLCVAFGYGGLLLLSHTAGGSWSLVPMDRLGRFLNWASVDCWAKDRCVAVGRSGWPYPPSRGEAVQLLGNHERWTSVPFPAGPSGLSCATDDRCHAIGAVPRPELVQLPTESRLIDSGNGGRTWHDAGSLPDGQGLAADAGSLSCPSASTCYAIGSSRAGVTIDLTRDGGRTWLVRPVPSPWEPIGISCATVSSCVVAATHATGQAPQVVLRLYQTTDGGGRWRWLHMPGNPVVAGIDTQLGCSKEGCLVTSVLTAGSLVNGPTYSTAVYATHGQRATLVMTVPSFWGSSVSCSGETCWMVGELTSRTSFDVAVWRTRDDGSSWDTTTVPVLHDKYLLVWGVIASCPTTDSCELAANSEDGTYLISGSPAA